MGVKAQSSSIQTPICWESGVLGFAYVVKSWVDANRNAVRDSHAISDTVTLGDGDTQQTINEEVDLLVDLKGPDGVTHSKVLRFKVMETSFTHIIGLPDIEEQFLDLFLSLLRMGAARVAKRRKIDSDKGLQPDSITMLDLGRMLYGVREFTHARRYPAYAADTLS